MQKTPWIPALIGPIAIVIVLVAQAPNLRERLRHAHDLTDVISILVAR